MSLSEKEMFGNLEKTGEANLRRIIAMATSMQKTIKKTTQKAKTRSHQNVRECVGTGAHHAKVLLSDLRAFHLWIEIRTQ